MDIQSNKYLAGRHLSNYVEIRGEVIHSRAVVPKNSHFEVILGQLSKDVGWLVEKKNDIVVLSDLKAYYVQLCIRTIILGSRRSTAARPVSLNLTRAWAAISIDKVAIITFDHAEVKSISADLYALARRPEDHAKSVAG